jgi:DUF1680 family protein
MEGKKEKATHENTWCEGQGTLAARVSSIAPDGIYLNLYEPSTIRWQQDGQSVELKLSTRFPFEAHVSGTIKAASPVHANLRVRIPSWAAKEISVSVNGKIVGTGKPGTYVAINRHWSNDDAIDLMLPVSVASNATKERIRFQARADAQLSTAQFFSRLSGRQIWISLETVGTESNI